MKVSHQQLILLFIAALSASHINLSASQLQNANNPKLDPTANPKLPKAPPPPTPIATASYLSPDGLSLIVTFDRAVNVSASVESVERRRAAEEAPIRSRLVDARELVAYENGQSSQVAESSRASQATRRLDQCQDVNSPSEAETSLVVGGIQLCAKLLTKKTLKQLHKFTLLNCVWLSRVQFLIQLAKPVSISPVRISFQPNTISEQSNLHSNQDEISVQLNKLPLETLGLPVAPKLVLNGPHQVPPCGQFALSAHLFSPFGTQLGESLTLSWTVERVGFAGLSSQSANRSSNLSANLMQEQREELNWMRLQQVVAATRGNNLLLEAQLLQTQPQVYKFQLVASFNVGRSSVSLSASHQLTKLDFEAPIGTIYGSHILAQSERHNPEQDLLLLADIQVPECAANIKQVGLYWQVSDSRVRFEQTYAPYYLARANSLPEQSELEFRMNLFYGIRVKKFASASSFVAVGQSQLESRISDGLLTVSLGESVEGEAGSQLELFAGNSSEPDRFSYLWSCFDGKTAQTCSRSRKVSLAASNETRYELAASQPTGGFVGPTSEPATSGQQLLDWQRARQQVLRVPLNWLEPEARLWFGLRRFDRLAATTSQEQQQAEYALVSVQTGRLPAVSIGPVLVGRGRHRATVRNPLTGAVLLLAGAPAIIVGRLGPAERVKSFAWLAPNYIQPLRWTSRNVSNPLSGRPELLTELQLPQHLQLAFAHHQIQLVACSVSGARSAATLNLDVVQGVSQCRLNVSFAHNQLQVSVEQCNIPLGLSPITYQLYLADTSEAEGQLEASGESQPLDEYLNEADEAQLLDLMEPLTAPQLSAAFWLSGLRPSSLLALLPNLGRQVESNSSIEWTIPGARLRFGARVCDKVQTCRMFYSAPLSPRQLIESVSVNNNNSLNNGNKSLTDQASLEGGIGGLAGAESISQSLKSMIDLSRRANTAGNSIAAISVLNGAINIGQKYLSTTATSTSVAPDLERQQVEQQLQVAIGECLRFGLLSIQRQFHYSNSGQTNLVTQAMARILVGSSSKIEHKYRALRLLAQLTRRTIDEQVKLNLSSLAEMRSIQAAYESLFSTFSHFSLADLRPPRHSARHSSSKRDAIGHLLDPSQVQTEQGNRTRREESILAYLRATRQAYRALLSAAAIQVGLGESRQFHYYSQQQQTAELATDQTQADKLSWLRSGQSTNNKPVRLATSASSTSTASSQPSQSEIGTSLTHVSQLSSRLVELDLHDFGFLQLHLDQKLLNKLNHLTREGQLKCTNNTVKPSRQTNCSSFLLSVTYFAGKSPFRSLDESDSLKVPLLEVAFLSAIDGSNLIDLMPQPEGYKTSISFLLPSSTSPATSSATQTNVNNKDGSDNDAKPRTYKCYQFDEQANEWRKSHQDHNSQVDQQVTADERRINCTFQGGSGAFAAFLSDQAPDENSRRVSRVVGVSLLVAAVALLSLLACCASSARAKRKARNSTKADEDDDDQHHHHHREADALRHPEQTYRNKFGYSS